MKRLELSFALAALLVSAVISETTQLANTSQAFIALAMDPSINSLWDRNTQYEPSVSAVR